MTEKMNKNVNAFGSEEERKWSLLVVKFLIGILIVGMLVFGIIPMFIKFVGIVLKHNIRWSSLNCAKLNGIVVELESVLDLNDYFTLVFLIGSIIITSVFSYLLYKQGKTSNQISRKLADAEINRDKEVVQENATYLYFEMNYKMNLFCDIYLGKLKMNSDRKISTSENWRGCFNRINRHREPYYGDE